MRLKRLTTTFVALFIISSAWAENITIIGSKEHLLKQTKPNVSLNSASDNAIAKRIQLLQVQLSEQEKITFKKSCERSFAAYSPVFNARSKPTQQSTTGNE